MRRIGLVVHGGRAAAVEAAGTVRDWAGRHGVDVVDADVWTGDEYPPGERLMPVPGAAVPKLDLVITVGGDGTFLRGARVAAANDAPVLGVNVGRVGFLTEIDPGDIEAALDAFAHGRAETEERLTLTLRATRPLSIPEGVAALMRYGRASRLSRAPHQAGTEPAELEADGQHHAITAVNDVVFERLTRDRQASLGVYLDGRLFASYSADALIVATPTGSTAYSFAAGGPVLSPRLNGLVFTPVAPHMVFNRSLVLSADETVAVRVLEQSGQVAVSIDGQLRGVLEPGAWVGVYAGPVRIRLVRLHPADFYGRLRHRFTLTDAPATRSDEHRPPPEERRGPDASLPPEIAGLFRPR